MAQLRVKRFNQPGRKADGNSKWNSASRGPALQGGGARRPVMPPLVETGIAP
jgi:hypothetical protein